MKIFCNKVLLFRFLPFTVLRIFPWISKNECLKFLFIDRVEERGAALIIGVDIAGRPDQATVALVERFVGSPVCSSSRAVATAEGRRSVSVVNTSWRKAVSDGCHRSAVAITIRGVCTIRW